LFSQILKGRLIQSDKLKWIFLLLFVNTYSCTFLNLAIQYSLFNIANFCQRRNLQYTSFMKIHFIHYTFQQVVWAEIPFKSFILTLV
jgi:hypothetical protein